MSDKTQPTKRGRGRPKKTQPIDIPQQMITVAKIPPHEKDRLEWYEHKLAQIEAHIDLASSRDAAPLYNRAAEYRDKIDEIRLERERASGKHLSPEQLRDKLRSNFESMADDLLEMGVRIYLERHHLTLIPHDGE